MGRSMFTAYQGHCALSLRVAVFVLMSLHKNVPGNLAATLASMEIMKLPDECA